MKESIVISLVVTPIALVLGILSAGAGHGDYFLAKILFPYTLLSTVVFETINNFFLLVAITQSPIYGIILALSVRSDKFKVVSSLLIAIHILFVVLCFLLIGENF